LAASVVVNSTIMNAKVMQTFFILWDRYCSFPKIEKQSNHSRLFFLLRIYSSTNFFFWRNS
jgi:hypothetical protein